MFDSTEGRVAEPDHALDRDRPDAILLRESERQVRQVAAPLDRARWLAGDEAPLPRNGVFGLIDGLLRVPANLMHELATSPRASFGLAVIALFALASVGLFVGGFSGGYQLLAVPLKVCFGMSLSALLCLPSLYIFSCLAGGDHTVRATASALLAGTALTSILLVGFAPISWLFSQATDSGALMGALHLFFLLISAHFGLRLTRRALAQRAGRPIPVLILWSSVFVLVMLQMSTTLRPLVGPFDGLALADKEFFLVHWFS